MEIGFKHLGDGKLRVNEVGNDDHYADVPCAEDGSVSALTIANLKSYAPSIVSMSFLSEAAKALNWWNKNPKPASAGPTNEADERIQDHRDALAGAVAQMVEHVAGEPYGFTLVMYPLKRAGAVTTVSNTNPAIAWSLLEKAAQTMQRDAGKLASADAMSRGPSNDQGREH